MPPDRGSLWRSHDDGAATRQAGRAVHRAHPRSASTVRATPTASCRSTRRSRRGQIRRVSPRDYVVDLRDHMVGWKHDLDTADADGEVSVLAVVAVSDPVLIAASGIRDPRGWTASAVQDLVEPTFDGVSVGDLPDAVTTLDHTLIHHRFDCGLTVRWAHVTIDPPPFVAQHLRKLAEAEADHALALQRMELDKERIAVEAEQERDQQALDELRRHTERVRSEAETEAKRLVEIVNREASQVRRKTAEDAAQVRDDAEQKAKQVLDSARREAER